MEIVTVADNQPSPTTLPVNIYSGSSWAGAPVPGGPTITPDGRWIFCNNSLNRADWAGGEVISTGLFGHFYSDATVVPSRNLLGISEYSFAEGRVKFYDLDTLAQIAVVPGLRDFAGQLAILGGRYCAVGSGGNAAWQDGALAVIDLDTYTVADQAFIPLADNLTSDGVSELYVSAGLHTATCPRLGIEVWQFGPDRRLTRLKTFYLGVNRSVSVIGAPAYDSIRRLVFKPAMR